MKPKELILRAVLSLGECTTEQVLAAVAKEIPAAQAAGAGRRDRRASPRTEVRVGIVARGTKRLVTDCLGRLYREGRLRRIAKGVYAPLCPKIYKAC